MRRSLLLALLLAACTLPGEPSAPVPVSTAVPGPHGWTVSVRRDGLEIGSCGNLAVTPATDTAAEAIAVCTAIVGMMGQM